MDLDEVRKIIALMEEKNLSEFEWEEEGVRIKLRRGGGAAIAPPPAIPEGPALLQTPSFPSPEVGVEVIVSPMVGTFYRASGSDSAPFAEVGQQVKPDDIVGIIEAMKVMNEIAAEVSGEIFKVLVEEGQPVEFGQPLFKVKT